MKRLGIILCEVFEEEMLHILKKNDIFDKIIVVNNDSSKYFQKMLEQNFNPEKIKVARELCSTRFLKREYPLEIILYILPFYLHTNPQEIKDQLVNASRELEKHIDKLVLFYGLCGNSLSDIENLLRSKRLKVPINILLDEKKEIVDDCICALLGSREEYAKELYKEGGTWFMTIGWSRHWDKIAKERAEILGPEHMEQLAKKLGIEKLDGLNNLKLIFDHAKYKRLLALELGFEDSVEYKAKCEDFSSCLNLDLCYREGTLKLLEDTIRDSLIDL
ncbi:MAG: hypothetical protein APG10_01538 [Candidatus Methanofastidiosum methylothiophilum]|uniref:DUF1638 domain-containing protein n=1 Tax=Candidatus Methanofastidiosum methylothiophilum TaxID=1705564 RepID=A0A150II57_9EURY|nr:MAG: hypothetical protein APG10_01538 [Candidatus Methanofastidiosum methylthiophilus]